MNTTGNTILITGGGTGIGRGLAEAFHALGNHVVITGRRRQPLDEVTAANPGMRSATLDVADADAVRAFAARATTDYPSLNIVVHNAGVARMERVADQGDDVADAEAMIATNLLGPIRLNAALLPLLLRQPHSTVVTVTSGVAFVPLAAGPTYCATKAALHSYTQSLRYQLRDTTTEVVEIIPPYVQTTLGGERQATDPQAMPLGEYVGETMRLLTATPTPVEVCVERVKPLRFAAENRAFDATFKGLNEAMAGH